MAARRLHKLPPIDLQLFAGSGAGLNYVIKQFPIGGPGGTTYDSGPICQEARFYSKWWMQLIVDGVATTAISGWSVELYGTGDTRAWTHPAALPTTSWVPLPAPETEDTSPDAFAWANPLTGLGQALYVSCPLVAIRYVATLTGAAGYAILQVISIP